MNQRVALLVPTHQDWTQTVLDDFNSFLLDHAAAEKKASGMAMSMALHYRDKPELIKEMIDLSIEELQHFRECVRLIQERGLILQPDEKDPYVNGLRAAMRQGHSAALIDRLIVGGIIEARGCERFGLVEAGLPAGELKDFYAAISRSEDRHQTLFLDLAKLYYSDDQIELRLNELLEVEANLIQTLPVRAALH